MSQPSKQTYGTSPARAPESLSLTTLSQLRSFATEWRERIHAAFNNSGASVGVVLTAENAAARTEAAQLLATEAGVSLLRVDLSAVASKYIGETEKNLAQVFENAAQSKSMLFFDEADALFGKRSEVKDSHDRYANIEVDYLLQLIEKHTGVMVLATNLRDNIDPGFLRRLRYVVEIPRKP